MTIVILDSGYSGTKIEQVAGGKAFYEENGTISCNDDYSDVSGHGTAVTDLLLSQCNSSTRLFIIRILNSEEKCSSAILLEALLYVLENVECDLIHISAGVASCDKYMELKRVIEALYIKQVYVVAAYSNEGMVTYPAAFDRVFGVDISKHAIKKSEYEYVEDSIVNFRTSSNYYRVNWKGKRLILNGSSFSSTLITAKIAEIIELSGEKDVNAIRGIMKDAACYRYESQKLPKLTEAKIIAGQMKKVITFPFNKEIFQIASNEDQCSFEILGYYSTKFDINTGKIIHDVLPYCSNSKIVQNMEEIDWESNFDTIILGHYDEIKAVIQKDIIEDIIIKAKRYNKRIYSLANIYQYYKFDQEAMSRIAFPYIDSAHFPQNRFGKLRKTSKPLVAICGTSSKQGKFQIQLELKKRFQSDGYKLFQISTEPTGYLFDMDYVFPIGYESTVYVSETEAVLILNNQLELADMNGVDIIIAGCQSGTVPFRYCNLSNLTIQQIEFLMALNPDAVVLCINFDDDIQYIERTKKCIESINECSVVAFAMLPLRYEQRVGTIKKVELSQFEMIEKRKKIEDYFETRLFFIGNKQEIDDLYKKVIDFF